VAEVEVCRFDELPEAGARQFEVDGVKVAVVRIDADVYVIGDTCSHQNFSLSEGEVDTDTRDIECWKHGSSFSLETGVPDALPATRPVPVYDVRVQDGAVLVTVPETSGAVTR
jgi:3-phenylpropionate/trans-cinnamate dioxygenase ferredoxin subunit